jgi:hypothetical protein
MAQDFELKCERAKDYRLIQPNTVVVTGIDLGDGPSILLHFTTNTFDLLGETFPAVTSNEGNVSQIGPSNFTQKAGKVLEATVKLRVKEIGTLVPLLLKMFDQFPDDAKRETLEAIKMLQIPPSASTAISSP